MRFCCICGVLLLLSVQASDVECGSEVCMLGQANSLLQSGVQNQNGPFETGEEEEGNVEGEKEVEEEPSIDEDEETHSDAFKGIKRGFQKCLADLEHEGSNHQSNNLIKRELNTIMLFEAYKQAKETKAVGMNEVESWLINEKSYMADLEQVAKYSAEDLVDRQLHHILSATFKGTKVDQQAADRFANAMKNSALACGDGEEATAVEAATRLLLKEGKGTVGHIESDMVQQTASSLMSVCGADSLDVDYFVKHNILDEHDAHCSASVSAVLMQRSAEVKRTVNHHMQQVLAVHNETNGIGHAMLKHWQNHGVLGGPPHVGLDSMVAAPLSDLQVQRLHHVEKKGSQFSWGFDREKFCDGNSQLSQYNLSEVQGVKKCVCVDGQPGFVCKARHAAEVAQTAAALSADWEDVQVELEQEMAGKSAAWGPCKHAFEGKICAGPDCVTVTTKKIRADVFKAIARTVIPDRRAACCFGGHAKFATGWPAGNCKFEANLKISMPIRSKSFCEKECSNMASNWDSFPHFKISMDAGFCFGGSLKKKLKKLGLPTCQDIAGIDYWPNLGKMKFRFSLNFVVKIDFSLTAPVHELPKPMHERVEYYVQKYIKRVGTSRNAHIVEQHWKDVHNDLRGSLGISFSVWAPWPWNRDVVWVNYPHGRFHFWGEDIWDKILR